MNRGHGLRGIAVWALLIGCLAILVGGTGMLLSLVPEQPVVSAAARDVPPGLQGLVDQVGTVTGGAADISFNARTGKARFLRTELENPVPSGVTGQASPEQSARAFLSKYGRLFGLTDQANQLSVARTSRDADGRSFVRFQQVHGGVPVLGGELIVQVAAQGNGILSASGEAVSGPTLGISPAVSSSAAGQKAIALVARYYGVSADSLACLEPSLWVYNPTILGLQQDRTSLVWRTDVASLSGQPISEMVLVDAAKGFVALHFNQLDTVKSRQVYDAGCASALPGSLVRSEGGAASGNADADAAYTYTGYAYDFYWNNHYRDSIDGLGMALVSTVNWDEDGGCDYQNAFWDPSTSQFVFGTGFPLACDVVGHEFTHGVTQYESNLFYYMQSGAINEAFSDIWGEFTELTYTPGPESDRWLLGEDLPIGAGRDMQDPTAYGQPDKMTSSYYACGSYFDDGGGVHTNSGVANKAAYLIADGGSFNDRVVTGIGIAKTGQLFYEVQCNMLTSASDYADLYDALQQAATNLGWGDADCQTVKEAIDAVEMNQQPVSCPSDEAPVSSTGLTSTLFSDDMEDTASGRWASAALVGTDTWGYASGYATGGQISLWGYNNYEVGDCYVTMTSSVALPAQSQPFLHFEHAYEFDSYSGYYYDGGVVEYSTNSGSTWRDASALFIENGYTGVIGTGYDNPLGGRNAFVGCSNGYGSSLLGLSSLAGQSVRFRFRIGTDTEMDSLGWFIDDVQIYTEVPVLAPTVSTLPATDVLETEATLNGEITALAGYDFTTIDAGSSHSLAVGSDGTLWAWGGNANGQLGLGDTVDRSLPTQVGVGSNWVAVAGGDGHSLGLRSDGTLWAWGKNDQGQLGLGTRTDKLVPNKVGSVTTWVAVSAGTWHSLALRSDGTLYAWGDNAFGQLGVGSTTDKLSPTKVGTATTWDAISAGGEYSLGLRSGSLYSWGRNYHGELGLGSTTVKTSPQKVGTATNWEAIAAGYYHSLGLRSDGTLWSCGFNANGQLGKGDTAQRTTMQQVGSSTDWAAISAGAMFSLGIHDNGTVNTWGSNGEGELGLGDMADRLIPTQMGTATSWDTVVAGMSHCFGMRSDGTLWSWGWNASGQLGLDHTSDGLVPAQVQNAAAACEAWFEWGPTMGYGNSTLHRTRTYAGGFSASITGLQLGTYHYRACASNGGGVSYGADRTFTTQDLTAPPAPTLLKPASGRIITDNTPWLDWSDVTDASPVHYELQVDDSADFSPPVYSLASVGGSGATVSTELAGGVYYWKVRAVDALGNASAWTSAWSFTLDTTIPAVPVLLKPTDGKIITDSTPWLDWSDVTDLTKVHYQLQVDDSADFGSPAYSSTWVGGSGAVTPELAGGVYYWRVRAVDVAGNMSAWTSARTFTLETTVPPVPVLLGPVNGRIITDSTPWLDWSDVTDLTKVHYQIQVDDSADFGSPVYSSTWVGSSGATVTTELADGVYYWRVRAVDVVGNVSAWTSPWSFTVQ